MAITQIMFTKEVKDLKDENKKRDIERCLLHLGSLHI